MKRATASPPATPALSTLAALNDRVGEIRDRRRDVIGRIVQLEKSGTLVPLADASSRSKRADALEMLNGAITPLLDTLSGGGGENLGALRSEIAVIDQALVIAEQVSGSLRLQEARARLDARRSEWVETMHQIAMILIGLERALQSRDVLSAEIKFGAVLPGEAWPFVGRLSNSGSQIYRFLQTAVAEGWIKQDEFLSELNDARKVTR